MSGISDFVESNGPRAEKIKRGYELAESLQYDWTDRNNYILHRNNANAVNNQITMDDRQPWEFNLGFMMGVFDTHYQQPDVEIWLVDNLNPWTVIWYKIYQFLGSNGNVEGIDKNLNYVTRNSIVNNMSKWRVCSNNAPLSYSGGPQVYLPEYMINSFIREMIRMGMVREGDYKEIYIVE